MSTFEHKNSLRTIEAQIVQKLKNNEARPKCTGSYKKKRVFKKLYIHNAIGDVVLTNISWETKYFHDFVQYLLD